MTRTQLEVARLAARQRADNYRDEAAKMLKGGYRTESNQFSVAYAVALIAVDILDAVLNATPGDAPRISPSDHA